MGKGTAKKKQAKAADRWLETNKPTPARGYPCTRCTDTLASVSDLSQHHSDVHLGGGR